jgi:hypothetical protein
MSLDSSGDDKIGYAGALVWAAGGVTKEELEDGTIVIREGYAGGTLSQPLFLFRSPEELLEAATKSYVDSSVNTHVSDNEVHVTSSLRALLDQIDVTATEINYLHGVTYNIDLEMSKRLERSGDTMTGVLTLFADPVSDLQAATKGYVDSKLSVDLTNLSNTKLNRYGDTMTGHLVLSGPPTLGLHAVTKTYVDTANNTTNSRLSTAESLLFSLGQDPTTKTYVDDQDALKVSKAGDTMTGHLTLSGTPTAALHATPKTYVDSVDALKLDLSGGTMTGALTLSAAPSTPLHAATKAYVDASDATLNTRLTTAEGTLATVVSTGTTKSYVDSQDALKLNLTGGVLSGSLTLSGAPTVALHAATKQYVDNADTAINSRLTSAETTLAVLNTNPVTKSYVDTQDALKLNLSGGILTGSLTLASNPTQALHSATKQYVDAVDISLSNRVTATETSISVLNTDPTTKTYVDTQVALKVNKAGDSMTGALTLSGAPTAGLHAATKTYVDTADATKANKAGDTFTGPVILNTDPTVALQAATKQYVDTKLPLAGGTMTGLLVLSGAPTVNLHAATKQYVDTITTGLNTRLTNAETSIGSLSTDPVTKGYVDSQLALRVPYTGGTLTGALTLSGNPVSALQAVTKQYVDGITTPIDGRVTSLEGSVGGLITDPVTKSYVDTQSALKVNKAGDSMTGALTLSGAPTLGLHAATKAYVDLMIPLAGGTMIGLLTLSGAPTAGLHAATKTYVDTADALKLALAGGTMTGSLVLSGAPTLSLHAATKTYVDSNLSTHTSDYTVHLTAGQNTFLDAITVTATEVNRLAGVTSGVQGQLDGKLPLAGGTLTGDLVMTPGTVLTINTAPTANTDAVNKSYVDGLIQGLKWKDPILDSNLIALGLNTPPSPVTGHSYIVGTAPTGGWVGLGNRLVTYSGSAWVDVLGRALQVGDRIGVGFEVAAGVLDASVSALDNNLVRVTGVNPVTVASVTSSLYDTTLVSDSDSRYYGSVYSFSDTDGWVKVSSSMVYSSGLGLALNNSVFSVNLSSGIEEVIDLGVSSLRAKVYPSGGLILTTDGVNSSTNAAAGLGVSVDTTSIVISSGKLAVKPTLLTSLSGKLDRVGDTMTGPLVLSGAPTVALHAATKAYADLMLPLTGGILTGALTLSGGPTLANHAATKAYVDLMVPLAGGTMTGLLTLSANPTLALHAVTKQYVDNVDISLSARLTAAEGTIATLNSNPVTKTYVDAQDALKVSLSGGTMTGALTLFGAPTVGLHAATKTYVDTADALKVALTGGTMTGLLTLSGDPVGNLQAATKQYADGKISKSGDTMTGPLVLNADPTVNLQATTKQYVDSGNTALNTRLTTAESTIAVLNTNPVTKTYVDAQDALRVAISGSTMTGALTLSGVPTVALHAATKSYVDGQDALKVSKAGDTMTGALVLPADPTQALQAATKQYVDVKINRGGDTMTGLLTLFSNPSLALHAATKSYVDSGDNALNTRLTTAESTIATLNTDFVTKTYVDTQDNSKVTKTGDTMTGLLTLSGAPTVNLHAATKLYVDTADGALNTRLTTAETSIGTLTTTYSSKVYVDTANALKVSKTGDTMTGALVLSGAPTAGLHAATKTYVDAGDSALNTRLTIAEGTLATLNANPVTKSYVDTQDATKLALAGGTMTGDLTLSGDPTVALHAATKQYVDDSIANNINTSNIVPSWNGANNNQLGVGWTAFNAALTAIIMQNRSSPLSNLRAHARSSVFPKTNSFVGGVLLSDGSVFLVPFNSTTARIYDVDSDTLVTPAGSYPGGGAMSSAVLLKDGRVFMSPWTSPNAKIYNPNNNTLINAGSSIGSSSQFSDVILLDDGRVFLVPYNAATPSIYNPTTDTITSVAGSYPAGNALFSAGVLLPDGRVYMVPYNTTSARIYDPATGTTTTPTGTFAGSYAFTDGVLMADGRVFIVPRNSTTARIYDPVADTLTTPGGVYPGSNALISGELLMDGRIFMVPSGYTNAIVYDPYTNTISTPPEVYGTFDYNGAVLLPDGKLMLIPINHDKTRIYYTTASMVPMAISTSPFFNKG